MVMNIAQRLAQPDRNASFKRTIVVDHAVDPASDAVRGLRIARRMLSGISHINEPTVHDEAQTGFRGVKSAGYGRFGGKAVIDPLIKLRCITLDTRGGLFPM